MKRRGLPHDWPVRRRAVLESHPECAHCGMRAREVHHVQRRPPQAGKAIVAEDAVENLVPLCRRCHSRLTAAQVGWTQSGRGQKLWW